jgi:uncharacterized protein YjiS (DUF1127 family)
MQPAVRKETIIERNVGATHHLVPEIAGPEAHDQEGWWQRIANALFQSRMWSAQREIERHQDRILFWRRGLAKRGAHLRPIANDTTEVSVHAVASHSRAQGFLVSSSDVGRAFMRMPALLERWRKRVRARRELLVLSDSDLQEIRWTKAEAEAEGRKPFWQA